VFLSQILKSVKDVSVSSALLLARIMGKYCFLGWHLSSSVMLSACGPAGCGHVGTLRAMGPDGERARVRSKRRGQARGKRAGGAADTTRRASMVTSS